MKASVSVVTTKWVFRYIQLARSFRKSVPIALFFSLFLGMGYWTLTSTLTAATVGKSWLTQVGYAWVTGGSVPGTAGFPLPYQPTQPLFLAVSAYPNNTLITLMYITYFVGSLGPLFAYFWIPSKYFFAFSFDRVIPAKFSAVSATHWGSSFTMPHKCALREEN